MKTILFGLFSIIIAVSVVNAKPGKPKKNKKIQPLAKVTLNGVDADLADTMIRKFNNDYAKDVGLKSVSAWFSKDEITAMFKTLTTSEANTVSGVRFYFGEESKTKTKIKIQMLLVTTKQRTVQAGSALSPNEDYYLDKSNLTLQGKAGTDLNNQARTVEHQGGLLYAKNPPPAQADCPTIMAHSITIDDAYARIQRRHDANDDTPHQRDDSAYNTRAECFDICFIDSLFKAISRNKNLDGLRVYLGKCDGNTESVRQYRDVFILVPTHPKPPASAGPVHEDDFTCLPLCPEAPMAAPGAALLNKQPTIVLNQQSASKDTSKKVKKINKAKNKINKSQPMNFTTQMQIASTASGMPASAYDKGELCPYQCSN